MLDCQHKGRFPLGRGDDYIFQAGDVCGHNVIIATLPAGQEYGTSSAAALASQVKKFFPNLWFGLLIGVAAGLPNLSRHPPLDIRLGDVIVGLPEGQSAGLIAYDLGKETEDGFQPLRFGHVLATTETIVRSAIGSIKLKAPNEPDEFLPYYEHIKNKSHAHGTFNDPGQEKDLLYQVDDTGTERLVERQLRPGSKRTRVWYGPIGSGDKLMRNARKRNELRDKYHVIGLEMEAAGTMNRIPMGVIRGVCDYGDEHKNKEWQPFAAAMAAAYGKAILAEIPPRTIVRPKSRITQNVPLWLFDQSNNEAGSSRAEFLQCQASHDSEEFLRGYSNTSTFKAWLSRAGSSLWCQSGLRNMHSEHQRTAACLMRHTLSSNLHRAYGQSFGNHPIDIFYYNCSTNLPGSIPDNYMEQDAELASEYRETVIQVEPIMYTPEFMLRSFIAQATSARPSLLNEYADTTDSTQTALQNLKNIFVSLVRRRKRRLFLVVDALQRVQVRVGELMITLTEIASELAGSNCSVLLGGSPTSALLDALQSLPVVNPLSEFQECCESLAVEGGHTRRNEIVSAVPGTNEWIWSHPRSQFWRNEPAGALAIVGKPGSGKSVLAKSIMTKLRSVCDEGASIEHAPTESKSHGLLSAWFYSKRSGEKFMKHEVLLRSFLYEFLTSDAGLFDLYKPLYREKSSSSRGIWTVEEMERLMRQLANSGHPFLMIIDAVDEAVDDHIIRLTESLIRITGSRMKFIVLTRPTRLLDRKFWNPRHITLQNENEKDIRRIAAQRCEQLKRLLHEDDVDMDLDDTDTESGLNEDESTRGERVLSELEFFHTAESLEASELQQLCENIIERSEGVVLWVILVFDSLGQILAREGFLSLSEIRKRATQMPAGLDGFYTQFVQELQDRHDQNGLTKVRRALMWISAASEIKPFTLGELYDALAIPDDDKMQLLDLQTSAFNPINRNRIPANSWSGRRRIVQKLCGPFVEIIRPSDENVMSSEAADSSAVIQLMHLTVKDFLMHSGNAGSLRFHNEEATRLVQESAMKYVEIMIPTAPCEYAPVPLKDEFQWQDKIDVTISYFEELRLLHFCVLIATNNPAVRLTVQPRAELAILHGFLLNQKGQEPEEFPNSSSKDELDPKLFARGVILRFFREATRRGKPYAVRAMLSLSMLIDGWWRGDGQSSRNATLFTIFEHFWGKYSKRMRPRDQRGSAEARSPDPHRHGSSREDHNLLEVCEAVREVAKWNPYDDVKESNYEKEGIDSGRGLQAGGVASVAELITDMWPVQAVPGPARYGDRTPILSLPTFLQETLRRSRASFSTYITALYYLALLKSQALDRPEMLTELSELGMLRSVQEPRRMFLVALIVASKYQNDRNYSARAWSKISGLRVNEIASLEWAFLKATSFNLHVPPERYNWLEGIFEGWLSGSRGNESLWKFLDPT